MVVAPPPLVVLTAAVVLEPGGVAATVLADHLLPPPRTSDGGTGEGIRTSLLALTFASVAPGLLLLGGGAVAAVAVSTPVRAP